MEQKMDALHKLKNSQFKKTMEVRERRLNVKGEALRLTDRPPSWQIRFQLQYCLPVLGSFLSFQSLHNPDKRSCSILFGSVLLCRCGWLHRSSSKNAFRLPFKEEEGLDTSLGTKSVLNASKSKTRRSVAVVARATKYSTAAKNVPFVCRRRKYTSTSAEIKKRRIRTWTETPTPAMPNR